MPAFPPDEEGDDGVGEDQRSAKRKRSVYSVALDEGEGSNDGQSHHQAVLGSDVDGRGDDPSLHFRCAPEGDLLAGEGFSQRVEHPRKVDRDKQKVHSVHTERV